MDKIIFIYVFFVNFIFCSSLKKNINEKIKNLPACISANNMINHFDLAKLYYYKKFNHIDFLTRLKLDYYMRAGESLINDFFINLNNNDSLCRGNLENKLQKLYYEKNKIIENKDIENKIIHLLNIFSLEHKKLLIFIYGYLQKKNIYCVEDLKKISLLLCDFLIKNQLIAFMDSGTVLFLCVFFLESHISNIHELYNLYKEDQKKYYCFILIVSLFFLKTVYGFYSYEEFLESLKKRINNTECGFLENFFSFYKKFYFEENFLLNLEKDSLFIEGCMDILFQLEEIIMKFRDGLKKDIDLKNESRLFVNIVLSEKIMFYVALTRALLFNTKKNRLLRPVKAYDLSLVTKQKNQSFFGFIHTILLRPHLFNVYRNNLFSVYGPPYDYSRLIGGWHYTGEKNLLNEELKSFLFLG